MIPPLLPSSILAPDLLIAPCRVFLENHRCPREGHADIGRS